MNAISVSAECAALGLRVGAIVFRDLRIRVSTPSLREQIDAAAAKIQSECADRAAIRELPEVAKHHEILRAVGVKPRNHPPSTQKLLEYAAKHLTLPAVNNLVDAYNLVSIETRCSLGAHDLNCIELPVELRILEADASFVPLGQKDEHFVPRGEFAYVDGEGRILCRLDALQAGFSKVTDETTDAILIVEGTTAVDDHILRITLDTARKVVQQYCGGDVESVTYPA